MIEAARRVFPDYARRRAREFDMPETIGSATASSSNARPSRIEPPFPNPAPARIRPAIGKPVAKLGPTSTFTRDAFQSVASAQA
eukprot:10370686-Lingulodinium_polyedra.AAC.1